MFKISFCTAIKNRLHHLKLTLPQNITNNEDYDRLQFIILDYNSTDGLEKWVKSKLKKHIESGKLIYYRYPKSAFFHRSHSRNIAFKLADGDIVCNIDADNITNKGFAAFVNQTFEQNNNIFLTPGSGDLGLKPDFMGRICCQKNDFNIIGGYDESMEGYGFEDHDLTNRLEALGRVKTGIPPKFLNAIFHDDFERVSEERIYKMLHGLYLSHVTPRRSDVIFLLNNGTYLYGTIIDRTTIKSADLKVAFQPQRNGHHYTLKNADWMCGEWAEGENGIVFSKLNKDRSGVAYKKFNSDTIGNATKRYHKVINQELITNLILFQSQFKNRTKMKNNLLNKISITSDSFDQDIVFKNFDNDCNVNV